MNQCTYILRQNKNVFKNGQRPSGSQKFFRFHWRLPELLWMEQASVLTGHTVPLRGTGKLLGAIINRIVSVELQVFN